jgi:serine/threonine protein kinase
MMETFDWRKPVRARKKSRIATTAPEGTAQLSDFEMLSLLGTGTFGKVQLCLHSTTRQYYCMKILQKQTIYRFKQMDHVENEKLLLSTLKSPGIVQLFATFTTPESLMLLMEYVPGGELFFYIRKYGRLPEDVARFYAAELVLVILYLHERKVVYRDLKPENILLDVQGRLKLADFGFAKRVEDKTWTMCGTPDYLAPEIITGRGHDTAVDWWSLGVLIFEMLAGYPPFTDKDMATLFRKIQQPERLLIPSDFSQDATDLLRRLLVVDPSRRLGNIHPDISDIRTHPWFRPIDWDQLNKRNGTGPIVPVLQNAGDVGNFQDHDQPELPAPPPVSIPDDVQRVFDRF